MEKSHWINTDLVAYEKNHTEYFFLDYCYDWIIY